MVFSLFYEFMEVKFTGFCIDESYIYEIGIHVLAESYIDEIMIHVLAESYID